MSGNGISGDTLGGTEAKSTEMEGICVESVGFILHLAQINVIPNGLVRLFQKSYRNLSDGLKNVQPDPSYSLVDGHYFVPESLRLADSV